MSVEDSAAHPVSGRILDPSPIEGQQNQNPFDVAGPADQKKVITGFLEQADNEVRGLAGVLDRMQLNGLGSKLDAWARGEAQPLTAHEVEQGLGGDFVTAVGMRAGVSPEIVRTLLAPVLGAVLQQVAPGGKPVATAVSSMGPEVLKKVA